MLAFAEAHDLPIDAFERQSPGLLHAKASAAIAKEDYGVTDAAVLSAIERHISGVPGMSPLDTLVNVADFTEPGRSFPNVEELRAYARQNLNLALYHGLRGIMQWVLQNGELLHPATVYTYNFLHEACKDSLESKVDG
jgi:predicted HD superfamily hydrolase involved in NAD metabolism